MFLIFFFLCFVNSSKKKKIETRLCRIDVGPTVSSVFSKRYLVVLVHYNHSKTLTPRTSTLEEVSLFQELGEDLPTSSRNRTPCRPLPLRLIPDGRTILVKGTVAPDF